MKKVLITVIAALSIVAMVSCGASPQARPGFQKTKSGELAATKVAAQTGVDASSYYVYSTQDFTATSQLAAANINLAGIMDPTWAAKPITYFGASLLINSTYTTAYLYLIMDFEGDDTEYWLSFTSTGKPVVNGGLMQIQFVDPSNPSFPISLTTAPGTVAGSTVIAVTIQDAAIPSTKFANGTPFSVSSTPVTAVK
ncbi:MAG: hypothetical protein WCQ53_01205 [bacterium]